MVEGYTHTQVLWRFEKMVNPPSSLGLKRNEHTYDNRYTWSDRLNHNLQNPTIPLEELDAKVGELALKLTSIPTTQLISMKLIVNQAYDNMGLQGTQTLGPILDGAMRNTPEGKQFVRDALEGGVKSAVIKRDGPFNDYSQGSPENQPRLKSKLGL